MPEYDLGYHFDENLHEVPDKPSDMELYIHEQKTALNTVQSPVERVKILGALGAYSRILRELADSKDYLEKALEVIHRHGLHESLRVQNQIRLAHTYQWLKDFHRSNSIFQELLKVSSRPGLEPLADFIWQHAGKNHFDQMQWSQALQCFEKALALREFRQSPEEQKESSRQAIRATLQRMN